MNSRITKQLPSESRQSLGKTDSRYWAERIFKPISGTGKKSPHWAMQLCFKSKRLSFGLRTGNKEAAARIARDIYSDLLTLGIDGTLAKHRPDRADDKLEAATIGAWINDATKVFDGSPATFGSYARSLRLIAGDILSVSKSKKRFAASKKSVYRAKIEEAPLSVLTPEAIQAWRIRFVAQAGKSPVLQRTKKISANSLIRQARSLFSKKILKFITGVQHPSPIPFAGCEMFPRESMRYNSTIDPGALLQAANKELAITDPEAFLTLLLAIGAGLRRGEIDKLLWRQIDFQAGTIRIEATEAGGLKSEDSAGAVPIEAEFVAILRGYYAKATGPFLIGGSSAETESRDWGHQYRCKGVFKRIRPANYISRVDKRCDIVGGCVTRSLSTTARLLPSRQPLPNRALYCTGAVRGRIHAVGVNSAADFTPDSPRRVSW